MIILQLIIIISLFVLYTLRTKLNKRYSKHKELRCIRKECKLLHAKIKKKRKRNE